MLKFELKKINFLNLLITTIIVPLLANVFGLINYLGNKEILAKQWQSLWTQVSLFYFLFFFIPLIGIIVASLWAIEHKAGLKFIRTSPVKNIRFIINKSILAFIIVIFTQIYFVLLFFLFGKYICKFHNVDFVVYTQYITLSIIFSVPMIAIFNAVSIKIKSFGAVVMISVLVSIIGMSFTYQNIIPILSKVFGLNYLGIMANNQKLLSISDLIRLIIFGLLEIVLFIYIANKNLKYEK